MVEMGGFPGFFAVASDAFFAIFTLVIVVFFMAADAG